MSHTVVALVQDRPGVLSRAVSLFRRRGLNLASITVAASERPGVSRMTVVVAAENVERVVKQLHRLVEVLEVRDLTDTGALERETALARVTAAAATRAEIIALCTDANATVLAVGPDSMVVEITDAPADVDHFLALLRPFGVSELARTGRVAMLYAAADRAAAALTHLNHGALGNG